jgi:predicted RNA-binding Zn ribbon-like protein
MTTSRAGSLSRVGGVLALDFANTVSDVGTAAAVDHLQTAAHVLEWSAHAGGLTAAAARRVGAALARDRAAGPRLLRRALALRGAVRDIGAALARGEPAPPAALARLKDAARRALAGAAIEPDAAGGYRWDFARAPAAGAVLGPVAWSAVDLLARGPLARLKQCPGPACGWLFLDRSKNGSRRWCDMATCGNRTKGRRHRARRA